MTRWTRIVLGCGLMAGGLMARASGPFVAATPGELSMTSVPGFPGAPAVVLNREQVTLDKLGVELHYVRIKILTEAGTKYANVQLDFVHGDALTEIDEIEARTIHADGTVIPYKGKPFVKDVERTEDYKLRQTVFTLPDVRVGSIVEYSYTVRHAGYAEAPTWLVQQDIPVLKEQFLWEPSPGVYDPAEGSLSSISWGSTLPDGAKVEHAPKNVHSLLTADFGYDYNVYVLRMTNVAPLPDESHMLPLESARYSVRFNYIPSMKPEDFWNKKGAEWSKEVNRFCAPNDALKAATLQVVGQASTQDEKLHRIYMAVMALENTDYTRKRGANELKVEGFGKMKTAADVWARKSGDSNDLARLFLAMVRAAGMEAYAVRAADRSERLFNIHWLNFEQLTDEIVAVPVQGGARLFDPGTPFCDFGRLAWEHTAVMGMRQSADKPELGGIPEDDPRLNGKVRTAKLTMDANGEVAGTIDLYYTGSVALKWRKLGLTDGDDALAEELRKDTSEGLPSQWTLSGIHVEHSRESDQALHVTFSVSGNVGAGHHMIVPVDVFEANAQPLLEGSQRTTPVMFEFPYVVQDTLALTLPAGAAVEAAPTAAAFQDSPYTGYHLAVQQTATTFVAQSQGLLAKDLAPVSDYPALLDFYGKVHSANTQSVVLKVGEK